MTTKQRHLQRQRTKPNGRRQGKFKYWRQFMAHRTRLFIPEKDRSVTTVMINLG